MNEFYRTKGLVIGKRDFLDSDKILTIFTEDMGKISVKAKGIKKIKAKMAGHLETFNYVDLELVKGHSLYIVTGAQVVNSFDNIKGDFSRTGAFYYITEVLSKILAEDTPQKGLFQFLLSVTTRLEAKNVNFLLLTLFFELNVLDFLGFRPEIVECVGCRESIKGHRFYFSDSRGGVLCETCGDTDFFSNTISKNAIKLMRLLTTKDFDFIEHVKIDEGVLREVKAINSFFIEHVLGREIKSSKFITV